MSSPGAAPAAAWAATAQSATAQSATAQSATAQSATAQAAAAEAIAEQVAAQAAGAAPALRLALDPERLEQDLARLVLTLVEFIRRLMEAQAVRRLEAGSITPAEAERLGLTLMQAREAVLSLCLRLDVAPDSLNLDLGPLGRLM